MEPPPPTTTTTAEETTLTLSDLRLARSGLANILRASSDMEASLTKMDTHFDLLSETLATTSKTVVPLQSLSMSTKALNTRINRAVSPALKLLEGFSIVESLQDKLLRLSSRLQHSHEDEHKRLKHLMKYVACVDRLNAAIELVTCECETALQKLQEVVEFLSRTKATDRYRIGRLRETVVTLSTLHRSIGGEEEETVEGMGGCDLGSVEEVEVLRRISDTLATSNCLDICIDIFVKVRYRRAAKALMRLSPEYLKTYTPEEIDDMEWESLETAITLWIQHFDLAVTTIFVSEKKLCNQVLSGLMDGSIWSECFVKVADKIMAVFFRFGEGVARSSREPQKLFKLLDMFASMEKLSDHFAETFEGEAGKGICERFRELQKLLVHASSKVFWEFGFRIEGNQDGGPPPPDGSVPKITRYAVNYLKYLATEGHTAAMAKVLRTEQVWKAGFLSKPGPDEDLLRDAVANVMDALERDVEAKKAWYADKALPHLFKMNAYW
ncbi:hypothetical protein QJS04_geneDACA006238 [Acorus gramineus]|uniref:Exocyst subunit Exo70 family protein n=1 Tax=Acorus gramineus TaxID=55184 RepID=A0AAV9AZ27_ACOGR|nr:hypothetical protein QJS04_geneDACA006238 [Acorus gramineus]